MIIKMDAAIEKAQKKIAHVSQDKEALRVYRMREMALSDFTSGVNAARREGEQRGIAIGEQRGEQKGIAKGIAIGEQRGITIGEQKKTAMFVAKLNRKGLSVEEISDLTDLPVEEVVKILKKQEGK
ncbi:MAG: hypothetical protein LBR08_09695 [Bacteroidales bacterium]|jgi:predicted transposase/invertase (TIGR01784 family)|nr:hypothetical protein [Bacteroidales bacterium]